MPQIYKETVCIFCEQMGRGQKIKRLWMTSYMGAPFPNKHLIGGAVAGAPATGPIRPISIESGYFHRGHVT